jgi:Trypsin-like peptidase domain
MSTDFVCEWKLSMPMADMGYSIARCISSVATQQMPELADLFPMRSGWHSESCVGDDWIAVCLVDRYGTGTPSGQPMGDADANMLKSLILPYRVLTHHELYEVLGDTWFSFDKFTYLGPYHAPYACWPHAAQHVLDWLNHFVVPEVLQRNLARTIRAIPELPQIDRAKILQSLWVLECEERMVQGTAFHLQGTGLITCDHVLGTHTHAFKPQSYQNRYPVKIIARNSDIDLAILDIDAPLEGGLNSASADDVQQLDEVVAAGFPNYRHGDTGLITPGVVTGFRTFAGFRHLLTNAPLIAGNSGGPVVDKSNRVIGVVNTGADRIEHAQETEKHGIVPIDAINYLRPFMPSNQP